MKLQVMVDCEPRGSDGAGEGHFGASRTKMVNGAEIRYSHRGEDLLAPPGSVFVSPINGVITRFGRVYSDTPEYKYIEVTDPAQLRHRFFYVERLNTIINVGDRVLVGTRIGLVQDISERYEKAQPHIHYEIKTQDGEYLDPKEVWT